jgi:release factor glutamine methyltransferase
MNVGGWLLQARAELAHFSDTAALDAQVLLADRMAKPRSWLLAHAEAPVPPAVLDRLSSDLSRLQSDVPLPYLLGQWSFYGRDFHISSDVLIPRPETEGLVELALKWLEGHPEKTRLIDVGTGSGCVALSIGLEHPGLELTAIDISDHALQIAAINAAHYQVPGLKLLQSDLLEATLDAAHSADLIVANLPYIPTPRLAHLVVTKREPILALDGGPDGLRLIAGLLEQSRSVLTEGGAILLEIDSQTGAAASQLARRCWPNALVDLLPDLAGFDRYMRIQTDEN